MRNFRNLQIWTKSITLAKEIYLLTGKFPGSEKFGITSQIQRAAVSIASNIAEGTSRKSQNDFIRFLEMSLGSAYEVETQLVIAKEIGYLTNEQYNNQMVELTILQKQINQLISTIRKNQKPKTKNQ